MKITTFAKKISELEGLKKQINIAQISELLKVINKLTRGLLYAAIKSLPEKS